MDKFINKAKELVKKIRVVDFIIVAFVVIALVVGFVTYKGYRQTADKKIEATSNIVFKVYMRGVTFSGKDIPIKKGEKCTNAYISTFLNFSILNNGLRPAIL